MNLDDEAWLTEFLAEPDAPAPISWAPHFPLYVNEPERDGPPSIYGYDGNIYPERASAYDWRQYRIHRSREKGTHTREQWIALRDSIGACKGCGATDRALVKDHILAISRGGCDCLENLQPLCVSCNARKGART